VRVIGHGRLLLVGAALALAPPPAGAHNLTPQPVRELLRMQGFKSPAPPGTAAAREVVLIVLGQPVHFVATEWRTFAFFESGQPPPAEPAQVALQGERPLLHSLATARPDQRITILAERRPGSADVFLLAVDLCPPR